MAILALTVMGLGALLAPALGSAAGGETPVTVGIEEEATSLNFSIAPSRLPSDRSTPATLKLGIEEFPGSEGIPPGLATLKIGLDRSIEFEPGDLPICRWPTVQIFRQATADAKDECPRAIVGHGVAIIEFAFPESTPIQVPAPATVYNGSFGAAVDLLIEFAVAEPLDGTMRLVAPINQVRRGRFGTEATIEIPRFAGGAGSLLDLQLELGRRFEQEGRSTGFVTAKCRDGKLVTTMAATLTDGTKAKEESVRACTP